MSLILISRLVTWFKSSMVPFMGQEGRVVEIENNKVKIMINMFGSETAAELGTLPNR